VSLKNNLFHKVPKSTPFSSTNQPLFAYVCLSATRRGTVARENRFYRSDHMNLENTSRIRDTVYVVGAGFSSGLGYPLTKSLLLDVWSRLPENSRNQMERIIEFHHPGFRAARTTSFPGIEPLLTEIAVNLELFDASRPAEGNFTKAQLLSSREDLLFTISQWFHTLYHQAVNTPWLGPFTERLRSENAAIVSFNWDLVLDQQLFGDRLGARSYGLEEELGDGPVLLKPHGSLNWYSTPDVQKVTADKRVEIFPATDGEEAVELFLYPRQIDSKVGRRYTPLIIPPTYLKDFSRPIFRRLWNQCTDLLSTPRKLIFLGYSLPAEDLHAQFIFRCGFHNQVEGRLRRDGSGRHPQTGLAEVIIVNPDQDAARRIEAVAGPKVPCTWIPKRIQDWLELP
jgi:hypothetical protein